MILWIAGYQLHDSSRVYFAQVLLVFMLAACRLY
jgi:hypothetical protein